MRRFAGFAAAFVVVVASAGSWLLAAHSAGAVVPGDIPNKVIGVQRYRVRGGDTWQSIGDAHRVLADDVQMSNGVSPSTPDGKHPQVAWIIDIPVDRDGP